MLPLGLFPCCLLCQQRLNHYQRICADCRDTLPWVQGACQRCARLLPSNHPHCGHCQQHPPAFDQVIVALDYVFPVEKLILGGKFSQQLSYLALLADLFLEYHQQTMAFKPDLLIPVPLHAQRLRERGYNQALELAKIIGRKLVVPVAIDAARRIKPTIAQAHLTASARTGNVKNAFEATLPLSEKRIAIVDDVLTTGSTVQALSVALRRAGASNIDVYCMARSLGHKTK